MIILETALIVWFVIAVLACIIFGYCISNRTSAHIMTIYDAVALYILVYSRYFIALGAILGVWYIFLII